jgi:hypothetical protein
MERHWRNEREAWLQDEVMSGGVVPFPCPETEVLLTEIYEGL